jgi:hypothetical protein
MTMRRSKWIALVSTLAVGAVLQTGCQVVDTILLAFEIVDVWV